MEGKGIFRAPGYSTRQLLQAVGLPFSQAQSTWGFHKVDRGTAAFSSNCSNAAPSTEVQATHSSLSQSFGQSLTHSLTKQIILGSQSSLLTE